MIRLKTTMDKVLFFIKGLINRNFREGEILPWLQRTLKSHWKNIHTEINESEEMLSVLWRYANGEKVTAIEKKMAIQQLMEIVRLVPALAIFLLPGGAILLPLIARALPWDLLPSSFRKKKE